MPKQIKPELEDDKIDKISEFANTQKEIQAHLPENWTEQKMLTQIKSEVTLAQTYVIPKRVQFRDRIRLYQNQKKQRDKIGDVTSYNIINTLLAVFYMDKVDVQFDGRKVGDEPKADNLRNLAKFYYTEMELEQKDYQVQWDRFFYGVGIRSMATWDSRRLIPEVKTLNPLNWLPDPYSGVNVESFRFMGFENQYNRMDMTEEKGFFNLNYLDVNINSQSQEAALSRTNQAETSGYAPVPAQSTARVSGQKYDLIDQFTRFDGVPYLVTCDAQMTHIYRCVEIEAVSDEEKEDPRLIPYPIILNYYSPLREDPFGVSVMDLVEDKQRHKSVIKNLQLNFAKSALYPMYIYNRDKIRNRRDMDFNFNKFIAVNLGKDESLNNVIVPMNKAQDPQTLAFNQNADMDADVELATGASKLTQGVVPQTGTTATAVDAAQANMNLMFLLKSRINNWGETDFWRKWLRMYRLHMNATDKIEMRLKSPLGSARYITIKKKDFITKQDPDIVISSKLDTDRQRDKDKLGFSSIYPMIAQDPTTPAVSKNFAKRKMLRLYGNTDEEIYIMCPPSPDESRAMKENILLSRNDGDIHAKPEEDHLSHIVVHSEADITAARQAHIMEHEQLYIDSGQAAADRQMQQQAQMGQMGATANAMTGSMISQNTAANATNKGSVAPNQ